MNIADLPEDSETSDEDYIPEGTNTELPSEEESDGDAEDPLPECEDVRQSVHGSKRRKKTTKIKKKRKASPMPEENKSNLDKKETDDLWASFMKDTGFKTRAERLQTSNRSSTTQKTNVKETETNKKDSVESIKVTQIFKFAGEEVKVEKEVPANSIEARLTNAASGSETSKKPTRSSGLSSVLNQLGKKNKISTLEKSKLDWEQFKKEENIQDELTAYSKSKDGYLERQDFLERADLRRFEIEKRIRSNLRSNRLNNGNM